MFTFRRVGRGRAEFTLRVDPDFGVSDGGFGHSAGHGGQKAALPFLAKDKAINSGELDINVKLATFV